MSSAQRTITSASTLINAQYFDYAVTERLVLIVATRPARFARSASPKESKSKGSTSALFPIPHFLAN
ncbi:hypothetical protein [Microcoleus sp. S13C4]|uniref:hypothetical protein n=1 Tax=Microcoleus sp. S13C4 TaxID=3055410 RepID=UPI002FD1B40A